MVDNARIAEVMNIRLDDELPEPEEFQPDIRRARHRWPVRTRGIGARTVARNEGRRVRR